MILEQTFTRDWLLKVNSDLNWNRRETQLKNLEKAVAALYLLECLSKANIDFIFKGGTSLLLLLGKIYRLSVDIDLIIETPLTEPLKVFTQVCSDSKLFSALKNRCVKLTAFLTQSITSSFTGHLPMA